MLQDDVRVFFSEEDRAGATSSIQPGHIVVRLFPLHQL